jgi:hypothetical protein
MRETHPNKGGEYIPGDHWLVCDSCGLDYRRSVMRLRWDNMMVCPKDFEPRHPQEFVRGIKEKIAVDIARPDSPPVFITTPITPDDL